MTTYGGGRKVPIFLYQHTFLGKILPPFVLTSSTPIRANINYISSFDTGRVLAQKRSMTDSDDAVVTEIIREIVKHGASAGVRFRQTVGGSTPARYPTEAVLTAVRMLAEAADADHSPMGAELRAMIEHVDPNLPIEIVYPGAGPVNCITETTSVHGLWWCYRHPENQPRDTLTTAIDMARDVAAQEKPSRAARPTLWRQPRSPRGLSTCSPPIIPTSPRPASRSCAK